jgi:hypothetical protein
MREALMHYVTLPALAGVEEARCRGDESSQGFSPEAQTRCDGCAALDDPAGRDRVWANWPTAIPCARWRPPTFRSVYSPKTPQSAHVNKRIRAK